MGRVKLAWERGVFEAWLRCPLVTKSPPAVAHRGPMYQRHTVGLDIPCPVARLQSRTPLLQAPASYAKTQHSTSRIDLLDSPWSATEQA